MKFIACLLYSLLIFTGAGAQQLPKTLLWRISGKDGHSASYLYGTMHLTDDRVFLLGDSLFDAIAHSDGFAMELDPNSLTTLLIDEIQKNIASAKNVKDMLSAKEYKTYGPRLAKKLGKPLDEITSRDILREKNKWVTDAYRKGKMPTFLDTYLYDIARRQNKWTGGVEDADDQRGLVDEAVDESDIRFLLSEDQDSARRSSGASPISSMIDVYVSQDLSAIDSMDSNMGNRDVILIKRNIKMAARMDSLSGVRSMVFAVGAAHLPGEEGLISLLRKKGFDVQPVFSSRKIKASDYVVKEFPRTWETVQDADSQYSVSMPGKPADVSLYGVFNMKMYFDIFEGICYFSTAIRSTRDLPADSLMDGWAKATFKTKGKRPYTPMNVSGGKGRIYDVDDDDGYKKGLVLLKDGVLYLAFTVSIKKTEKNSKNAEQFIHSLAVFKRKPAADPGMARVVPYIDTVLAYRVSAPSPFKPFKNEADPGTTGWDVRTFISIDEQRGVYYFIGVNGITPGHYIQNDSAFFIRLRDAAMEKAAEKRRDSSWMWNGARVIESRGMVKGEDYHMATRYITRGNRWYTLVVMCPRKLADSPATEGFLSSFAFLDYPTHSWQVSIGGDSVFSTWSPAPILVLPPVKAVNKLDNKPVRPSKDIEYVSLDTTRSMSYSISTVHFSPYFWSLSDSAFWAARIKGDLSYQDTLLSKRPVKNGDVSGWDWVEAQRGSHIFVRRRALLYGDEVYYLFAAGLRGEIESENVNRFFDDFRFLRPAPATNFFRPKTQQLLEDLGSGDTTAAEAARSYLYSAPFTVKDLPLLHQTLLRWHSGMTWSGETLTREIADLHDSSSFHFAADNYAAVPDTNIGLKNDLLLLMAGQPDSGHYAILAHLLRTDPPAGELSASVKFKLGRAPKITAFILPDLLPLLKDSLLGRAMVYLIGPALDSGWLDIRTLGTYRAILLDYAARRLRDLTDPDNVLMADKEVIAILRDFNDAGCNALLHKFLAIKDNYIRLPALKALLRNKEQPAAAGIRELAADKSFRLDTYRELKKYGRAGLLPLRYRTPNAFAEAIIHGEAADWDDEEIDSLVFVNSVIRNIGHGPQKFIFYRVIVGESSNLACAGPFSLQPPPTADWYKDDGKAFILFDEAWAPAGESKQMDELLAKFRE